MKITTQELMSLGVQLGLVVEGERDAAAKMVKLAEETERAYAQDIANSEGWERKNNIKPETKIEITPQGHFAWGNPGPLLEVLRAGKADAELQSWLADTIERGGFAKRKAWMQQLSEMGPLGDAAVIDYDNIIRILEDQGSKRRGAHARALEIVALHRRVRLSELQDYFKRSKKDRHRL